VTPHAGRARHLLTLVAIATAGACHHARPAVNASPLLPADSLQGVVSVTGTSFEQRIVLHSNGRSTTLSAAAADSAALSRVGGMEIVVHGQNDAATFRAVSFTVRRLNGTAVLDGVLRADGPRIVLDTADGQVVLGNPPAPLRTMIGARVWIAGPPATGPNSYGVIVPAR
jgi:hypothetical protein